MCTTHAFLHKCKRGKDSSGRNDRGRITWKFTWHQNNLVCKDYIMIHCSTVTLLSQGAFLVQLNLSPFCLTKLFYLFCKISVVLYNVGLSKLKLFLTTCAFPCSDWQMSRLYKIGYPLLLKEIKFTTNRSTSLINNKCSSTVAAWLENYQLVRFPLSIALVYRITIITKKIRLVNMRSNDKKENWRIMFIIEMFIALNTSW